MRLRKVVYSAIVLAGLAAAQSTALRNYKPVTAERLTKPEDGDWP